MCRFRRGFDYLFRKFLTSCVVDNEVFYGQIIAEQVIPAKGAGNNRKDYEVRSQIINRGHYRVSINLIVQLALRLTFISFAMGWTSVLCQPGQKPIRFTDDENKN